MKRKTIPLPSPTFNLECILIAASPFENLLKTAKYRKIIVFKELGNPERER